MEKIVVIVEPTQTGYSAFIPELPGVIAVGDCWRSVKLNMQEALAFHLDELRRSGDDVPRALRQEYELEFDLEVESLFEFIPEIKQTIVAQLAGINSSLLRQYARGIKKPGKAQVKKIEAAIHELGRQLLKVRLN